MAEHASLTGSLDKGSRTAIRQYNHIREHLQNIGAIPVDLFQNLDEDEASFDELGIVCGMLEGYLVEDEEILNEGKGSTKVQVGMVGLKELEDLKEIGKVIRESLPDFLRKGSHGLPDSIRIEIERNMREAEAIRDEAHRMEKEAEREARRAEREAEREARHSAREARREGREDYDPSQRSGREDYVSAQYERTQQMAEITNQIREVGERLRQPDLQNGQREELLQRLDQLMTALQQTASGASAEE